MYIENYYVLLTIYLQHLYSFLYIYMTYIQFEIVIFHHVFNLNLNSVKELNSKSTLTLTFVKYDRQLAYSLGWRCGSVLGETPCGLLAWIRAGRAEITALRVNRIKKPT